jgi:hypothetical protein
MPAYARASTLSQQVRSGTARPAESEIALDVFKQLVGFAVSGTVVRAVAEHSTSRDAFDAIRHECATTTPNLTVSGPEESFLPLRPVTERGESFRGKHGRLTVIRKVR